MVDEQPEACLQIFPRLRVLIESWPIAGAFTISRGSKTEARVIVAELHDGHHIGRGECVPYARYGESVEGVAATIEAMAGSLAHGLDRAGLQRAMPAGSARNALDCAFWDLEAKHAGKPVDVLAGIAPPRPLTTAYTISLGTPDIMAQTTRKAAGYTLLKIKLGGTQDPACISAVRTAAPNAELIVDANEGWTPENLIENLAACAAAGVTLVEQPLPAGQDNVLATLSRPIPVCADESAHDRASLPALVGRYDAINVKLDKTGGLTEAFALADAAERMGFALMVGCMISTSLAIAPALLIAQRARVVDLDGPLLLAHDRGDGLRYEGNIIYPSAPALWG